MARDCKKGKMADLFRFFHVMRLREHVGITVPGIFYKLQRVLPKPLVRQFPYKVGNKSVTVVYLVCILAFSGGSIVWQFVIFIWSALFQFNSTSLSGFLERATVKFYLCFYVIYVAYQSISYSTFPNIFQKLSNCNLANY